ncbi:MAG: filamentous hemagglutinin N-terminal domain-containing protein, partial [Thermodesulfobacteriota bacterium]
MSRENRTTWFIKDKICKWKQRKGKKGFIFLCSKFLVMGAVLAASIAGIVEAAPTGGVITNGSGDITQEDTATNIQQNTQRLDINWQTFSTGVAESINFFQPNADSIAINRVIGGLPSELMGALTANGRVFVLNNAGITFYSTSHVNVGALLATTADVVSEDGTKLVFSNAGYGAVSNQGEIHVSDNGFAILAAPHVENTGIIQANLGQIRLASTTDFTLDLRGDGLIEFAVPKEVISTLGGEGKPIGVDNTGTLRAGVISISANLASGVIQSVVNLDGVIDASAFAPGQDGGTVLVDSRGGINITGEIHANAVENGNGGAIYTWADGVNNFTADALITANGGAVSGDGGFIELSGNNIRVRGDVSLSAPNGKPGTILLDPPAITIENGTGSGSTATVYEQWIESQSVAGVNVALAADDTITMSDLATDGVLQGGSGDISLSVLGDDVTDGIFFDDITNTIRTTTGGIILNAVAGSGAVSGGVNLGNLETTGNDGHITINAGSGGIRVASIATGGIGVESPGDVALTTVNNGDITTGPITITASTNSNWMASADLNINAGGGLIVNGDINVTAFASPASTGTAYAYAYANLYAANNITVNGNVTVDATAINNANSASYAMARAYFYADAAISDLSVTGNILVSAYAEQTGVSSSSSVSAQASACVYGGNIDINGNVTANATALNTVNGYYGALDADAYLYATAIGDLSINGDILVSADAGQDAPTGGAGYA